MNRKGFVLVESIVTSVFVLGLFTFIVSNILPLIAEYDKGFSYDTIESVYDAHMIRKMILRNSDQRVYSIVNFSRAHDQGEPEYFLFDGQDICLYLSNKNYCKKLLSRSFLDVRRIIITTADIQENFIEESKKFDRVTRDYIAQMDVTRKKETTEYDRRLIIVFNDGRVASVDMRLNHTIRDWIRNPNSAEAPQC
jgi:hypothetical protein